MGVWGLLEALFSGGLVSCLLKGGGQMTRGNQREKDREKAAARNGGKLKTKDDGLTPEQRRERDGKALQEKAAKKAEAAAAGKAK